MYENEKDVNVRIKNISAALNNELAYNDVIDYGYLFLSKINNSKLNNNDKLTIKAKCTNFLKFWQKL